MISLPSGTVPFLFTDIEGSTRLYRAEEPLSSAWVSDPADPRPSVHLFGSVNPYRLLRKDLRRAETFTFRLPEGHYCERTELETPLQSLLQ